MLRFLGGHLSVCLFFFLYYYLKIKLVHCKITQTARRMSVRERKECDQLSLSEKCHSTRAFRFSA